MQRFTGLRYREFDTIRENKQDRELARTEELGKLTLSTLPRNPDGTIPIYPELQPRNDLAALALPKVKR